jgi:hypothetical protein
MSTVKSSKYGVSIEFEEGHYVVMYQGEALYKTKVLASAEIEYDGLVEHLSADVRKLRARENAHYVLQAVRSDAFDRRARNARKQGGRGGRGGV